MTDKKPATKQKKTLQVHIHGKCGGRLKKIITDAAEFYLSIMMPRHDYEKLTLQIYMRNRRGMKGDEGTCMVIDTNYRNIPTEFELEINRDNNTKTILYNLAHEMVHVKQFATKELNEGQSRWLGKYYDDEKIDYWDLPWEIDAYGRERGLYIRYIQKYKLDSIDEEFLFV